LIGRQIYQANWGLIDDHEIFHFLGPNPHLPLSEIWTTLLAKTEVGTLKGRFRPGYYVFKLIETSLWGTNVHLWYLARTICFAVFLSSIWWFMRRFAGIWLAGILTLYISLLPMWAGVWSRLGPSEIYGAACIGILLFSTYLILFSDETRIRNASAITLALATIALISMKETFIPIAGGTALVFLLAGVKKRLSPLVIGILALIILAPLFGVAVIVRKQVVVQGADYYSNAVELWPMLVFFAKGLLVALARTWWVIVAFGLLSFLRPPGNWITAFSISVGAYGFLVATYATQCALYRSGFPLNLRYDFPAMLLVPLSLCVLACYGFYLTRMFFSERTFNYTQLATAAALFLCLAFGPSGQDKGQALIAAVRTNIEATNSFYGELQLALREAQKSPENPVILEAYGSGAYEAVFSLSIYLPALGAKNPISVRLHPEGRSNGKLYDGLQRELFFLEATGNRTFTPLRDNLPSRPHDCLSIGINGSPDADCSGFQVKTL
jgi:hypothetical protein